MCLRYLAAESDEFDEMLTARGLTAEQSSWFRNRYETLIASNQLSYTWTRIWFWTFTTVISIGSVLLVMLSSLGAVGVATQPIACVAIAVSTLVALSNKFLYAGNNVQKKYISDRNALEKLRSYGWKLLSGPVDATTFAAFVARIESTRSDWVQEQIKARVEAEAGAQPVTSSLTLQPQTQPQSQSLVHQPQTQSVNQHPNTLQEIEIVP